MNAADFQAQYMSTFVREYTKEEEVQHYIKMGKERGISVNYKMRFGDEVIAAWVAVSETYHGSAMDEEMRDPHILEKRATEYILRKEEYYPYLTIVDTKVQKEMRNDPFEEYFVCTLYFCHGEILLLKEDKPHLFV